MHSRHARPAFTIAIALLAGCDPDDALGPEGPDAATLARAVAHATLTVTPISSAELHLGWPDSWRDDAGFEVHRSTNGIAGTYTLRGSTPANVATYSDVGLARATEYCYKVRAILIKGRNTRVSEFLAPACGTTFSPPSPPSAVTATPDGSLRSVLVAWNHSEAMQQYYVERAASDAGPWTRVDTVPGHLRSSRDAGRIEEQPLCYRVIAWEWRHGESAPSGASCTLIPAGPSDLAATQREGRAVELTWKDNSASEDGYEVRRSDGSTPVTVATLAANTTSHRDETVPADGRYWYEVRARRDGGFSASSSLTLLVAIGPPPAPHRVDVVPWLDTVYVSWLESSSSAEGYRIERSLDDGASWTDLGIVAAGFTGAYPDVPQVYEQRVCHRVVAVNGLGESPSGIACTVPPASPQHVNMSLTSGPNGPIADFTWTDDSRFETGYEVYYVYYSEDFDPVMYLFLVGSTPADATSLRDESWQAGGFGYGAIIVPRGASGQSN